MSAHRIKVIFYDQATAMGGSLMVLSHLFKELDRSRINPMLVTALSMEELNGLFDQEDIVWAKKAPFNYATRIKWESISARMLIPARLVAYTHTLAEILFNSLFQLQLLMLLYKKKVDLIHINNGFLPFFIAWILRVPAIFHCHGLQTRQRSRLVNKLLFRCRAFIAISQAVSSSAMVAGYPKEKIKLIYNPAPLGPEDSKFVLRRKLGIPQARMIVTHVGRLVPWKGQLQFLQAFARIDSRGKNLLALIVGDSGEGFSDEYKRQLLRFVEEHSLAAKVRFTGHVTNALSIMAASDIVVHSSIEPEPFGLVITEAMSAGVATIASDLGAPSEIIEHGVDGLIVSPLNAEELGSAIQFLLDNDVVRNSFAERGKQKAASLYSASTYANKVTELYEECLK
jgi:glycosyltransferase involved in cell wall biosynthesis